MARVAHNKTNFSEIVEFFKNSVYILLDDDYVFKRKINFKDKYGYLYQAHWYDIKNNKPPSKFGNGNNFTFENINYYLNENGDLFQLLNKETKSVVKNVEFKCNRCGNIFISNFHAVKNMSVCVNCTDHRRLDIEKIKNRIELISPTIIILSDVYIPNEKIKCKCNIDGHVWFARIDKLSVGKGCPECKRLSHIGEKSPSWKGGITPLHNKLRAEIGVWKRNSFIATQYKCIISGVKANVVVHHLYPFNKIVEESLIISGVITFDITDYNYENYLKIVSCCTKLHDKYGLGVPLAKDIHEEFHSIYGKSDFTKENFYEFYFNKTGKVLEGYR